MLHRRVKIPRAYIHALREYVKLMCMSVKHMRGHVKTIHMHVHDLRMCVKMIRMSVNPYHRHFHVFRGHAPTSNTLMNIVQADGRKFGRERKLLPRCVPASMKCC